MGVFAHDPVDHSSPVLSASAFAVQEAVLASVVPATVAVQLAAGLHERGTVNESAHRSTA